MTTISIQMLLLISITALAIYLFLLYKKERNKYSELFSKTNKYILELNKPLRYGYYKTKCLQGGTSYTAIIYIIESDRYTNGDSKIKLKNIEIDCDTGNINRSSAEKFIEKGFLSLMKTSEITWLESEIEIKEQRRSKIEHLK